ncbi:MAG: protein translocase subunit SecD [Candidatus Nomurabacteria bacterium]|nr:protein translocase subunit SecD [Candidatus Nomurabacteria bacterium]
MWKKRVLALIILILGFGVALFVYKSEYKTNKNFGQASHFIQNHQFHLGLDLSGGTHLIYQADVSALKAGDVADAMNSLRDVIERRINLFGVSEPVVQVEEGGIVARGEQKLIIDLPGVTDVEKATAMIGQTPLLEFKIEAAKDAAVPVQEAKVVNGQVVLPQVNLDSKYVATELTGRYLKQAVLEFDQNTREPKVSLQFDDTGTALFAKITKENIGKIVAIYLDGAPVSTPVVREEIPNGQAVISGSFTPTEAKQLVGRLNSGALPVPITLLSRQTIGSTLGASAIHAGVKAGIIGFLIIALFLILWYRLPGVIAVLSLSIYISIMLALFKLMPVTLTAAGIAGFIISIGIAVDANVLIFERVKEELRLGHSVTDAVKEGFAHAWFSIRDSNISSIITALILFWFGTSLIKGFALTLGMGVIISMLSAITITRIFLSSIDFVGNGKVARFLFSSGLSK